MTSAEIRQSFLDFFKERDHTIVPSSSLLPDSPGLLFTNAGMNQFVPIFLNERQPDVASWAGAISGSNTRAADTQKCIRAGGKHNDLEDVGWDTYHHTFFEMLGNWSFGDYFKKESLTWGWELLTRIWGIPPKRLFATVYAPDKAQGDPAEFDQEAYDVWAEIFRREGLDPAVHIVHGGKKDNFWMMGDTGPCGPCSEIHFNLLPDDDEQAGRALVNKDSPRCIEIWNHVFIQFNAGEDGSFTALPARHVDTGMGFERVAGIHAGTKGFTDFTRDPSNYDADVFTTLFEVVSKLSGHTYRGTVPAKREGISEQERTDVAFRVIADHARAVSCAIADGILPGNDGRNYVIRRILRRGILYGRKDLQLETGFFEQLVPAVVASLGDVFPELREQQTIIQRVIRSEEESFGRTLDRGLQLFKSRIENSDTVPGEVAFELYDTYGFPLDMTQLLAAERGMTVDVAGFEAEMEKQRARARAARKKEVISVAGEEDTPGDAEPTRFIGYTDLEAEAVLTDVVRTDDGHFLVFDRSPFYAEMGGQAGDTGTVTIGDTTLRIVDTIKDAAGRFLHKLDGDLPADLEAGATARLAVDRERRRAISRHHSATHLIHWALREVLGTHVRQAGASKTPERLRFDFSHFEQVQPEQLRTIERLVNERVIDNARVEAYETEFDKRPEGTLAFFGEKYGRIVRVVDIGGYSRELCGGTHVSTTGEIGPVKIVAESAIAAGTRRIEAVAGTSALDFIARREAALAEVGARLSAGPADVAKKLDALLAQRAELEKQLAAFQKRAEAGLADQLVSRATERDGLKRVVARVEAANPNALRTLGAQVMGKLGEGVVVLGAVFGAKVTVVAFCSPQAIAQGAAAGKIVSEVCGKLGGKGGGKPDFAMGGGKDPAALDSALAALG
ncbi:MAG: alanine--tRNA ligase [Verrucomicrobia bacterium]|nr:MAG: alanine--tRNA ligase [Verrucomicrobiota bacterium]